MKNQWHTLVMCEVKRVERPLQIGEEDFYGVDTYDLEIGKPVQEWNSESFYRSTCQEDDGDPDDVLSEHRNLPTFSPRLQLSLQKAGVGQGDIQYLPVRVIKSTGKEIGGFCIANVIARLEALDRERCVRLQCADSIDPLTGKPEVEGVWDYAVRPEVLEGHDIIRLLEFFPPVFVSQRFVDLFRENKFTGADFRPLITPTECGVASEERESRPRVGKRTAPRRARTKRTPVQVAQKKKEIRAEIRRHGITKLLAAVKALDEEQIDQLSYELQQALLMSRDALLEVMKNRKVTLEERMKSCRQALVIVAISIYERGDTEG